MNKNRLFWVSVLLLIPIGFLLIWAIPVLLVETWRVFKYGADFSSISNDARRDLLKIGSGILAIVEVLRLVRRTIQGRIYRVGFIFIIAAILGATAAYYLQQLFGIAFMLFMVLPILILVVYLLHIQSNM